MNGQSLTEDRKKELESAFNGANSLALLIVFLILTAMPIWWISDKMTGWIQISGLVLLSLFTAFILMLFLTGLIKAMVRQLLIIISPEYRIFFREKHRDQNND